MSRDGHCAEETRRLKVWAALLFLGALALRLIYVHHLQASPLAQTPMLDELYHVEWARELAAGDWLGGSVFFRAPLYPYVLGIVLAILRGSLTAARVVQACYGALIPVVTLFLANRVCGRRCALIAGVLAAAYPFLIYFDNELLITSLIVLLDALLLLLILRADEHPSWTRWLGVGLVMGLSAIARPNVLATAPAIFLWMWLSARADARSAASSGRPAGRPRGDGEATADGPASDTESRAPSRFTLLSRATPLRTALHRFAVLVAGAVLIVLPVTLRNAALEKDFVLIASQGGINFFIGNNSASDGVSAVVPGLGEAWEYDDCERIAQREVGRRLKPSEVSAFWYRQGLDFLTNRPGDAFRLYVRKAVLFLDRYELANNKDIYYFGSMSWVFRGLSWLHFGVVAPLAALGALAFAHRRREDGEGMTVRGRRPAGLVALFVVSYAATVLLFFVNARFRMPVIPGLLIFSAVGLVWLWDAARSARWARVGAGLACVAVAATFVNVDFYGTHVGDRAQTHNTIGLAHAGSGRYEEAVASYDRAIELAPAYAKAWNNRGVALQRMAENEQALSSYAKAAELDPTLATAPNNIGALLWELGDLESAVGWLRRAVEADPWLAEAQYNLASVLFRLGDSRGAELAFQAAVRARPRFAEAWHDYGLLLEREGRLPEAVAAHQRAVLISPGDLEAKNSLAVVLAQTGQYREAIAELEEALSMAPGHPDLTANLEIIRRLMESHER